MPTLATDVSSLRNRVLTIGSSVRISVVSEADIDEIGTISDLAYTEAVHDGHAPILDDAWVVKDALFHEMKAHLAGHGPEATWKVYRHREHVDRRLHFGTCSRTCGICIHRIVEEEDAHEAWMSGVDPIDRPPGESSGVFTKSTILGQPTGGAAPREWAGIPMGEGIGGRVPNGIGDMIDDPLEYKHPFDAGRYRSAEPFAADKAEMFIRIARGDYSMIPTHDPLECRWPGCSLCSNDRPRTLRGRILARTWNAVLDVAERLRHRSSLLASMGAARRMMQAGASMTDIMESASGAMKTSSAIADGEPDDVIGVQDPGACGPGCFHDADLCNQDRPIGAPWPRPRPVRTWSRTSRSLYPDLEVGGGMWDVPGLEDMMPTEYNLDRFYVGIFR